ncbi:hypothetical protein PR048_019982 [Dryococelus australis]|uniref:Uncharacterized protein n=1 Tax=Dryococelus australis TaxID=614101 RepID=A0ABQ9H506_9NEOP|nr:hypothetical protein PR048_019982 [Dryococelus australis]
MIQASETTGRRSVLASTPTTEDVPENQEDDDVLTAILKTHSINGEALLPPATPPCTFPKFVRETCEQPPFIHWNFVIRVSEVNEEICAALNIEILRTDESEMGRIWSSVGMGWREERKITEKTCRPLSGTIPTCGNPGVTHPGIELGSPWWESGSLTITTP